MQYGMETPSLHNRAWLQSGVSICTLCRAKQRGVLCSSAFVESLCSTSQPGVAPGFPQSSCQISKFFPGCHSGKYSSVHRTESLKGLAWIHWDIYKHCLTYGAGWFCTCSFCLRSKGKERQIFSHFSYTTEILTGKKMLRKLSIPLNPNKLPPEFPH